jgi:hypothetical protein
MWHRQGTHSNVFLNSATHNGRNPNTAGQRLLQTHARWSIQTTDHPRSPPHTPESLVAQHSQRRWNKRYKGSRDADRPGVTTTRFQHAHSTTHQTISQHSTARHVAHRLPTVWGRVPLPTWALSCNPSAVSTRSQVCQRTFLAAAATKVACAQPQHCAHVYGCHTMHTGPLTSEQADPDHPKDQQRCRCAYYVRMPFTHTPLLKCDTPWLQPNSTLLKMVQHNSQDHGEPATMASIDAGHTHTAKLQPLVLKQQPSTAAVTMLLKEQATSESVLNTLETVPPFHTGQCPR